MRSTLKFLLCTMCCTMLLDSCGYSMDAQQDNFSIYDDIDAIVQAVDKYCKYNKYYIYAPNISELCEKYKSLQRIIPGKLKEYVSNRIKHGVDILNLTDNELYRVHIQHMYMSFCQYSARFMPIDKFADQLLQDHLDCIRKYSPNNSKVNCLFLAVWNILFKYSKDSGDEHLSHRIEQLISKLKKQTNMYLSNTFFENYTPRIITLLWEYLDSYLRWSWKYKFDSHISRQHDTTFHTIYDLRVLTGYSIDEIVEKIMEKYPNIEEELVNQYNDSHKDRIKFQEMIYNLLDEDHKFLMHINNKLMEMDEFCTVIPLMKGNVTACDFWGNEVPIMNEQELERYKKLLSKFEEEIEEQSEINKLQDNEFIEKMDQLLEKKCYMRQTVINSITRSRYNQSGDTFICTAKTFERYKTIKLEKEIELEQKSGINKLSEYDFFKTILEMLGGDETNIYPQYYKNTLTGSIYNTKHKFVCTKKTYEKYRLLRTEYKEKIKHTQNNINMLGNNNSYAFHPSQNPLIKIESEKNKFIHNPFFVNENNNDIKDNKYNDNTNNKKKSIQKDIVNSDYKPWKTYRKYDDLQPFNIDDLNSNSVVQELGDSMEDSPEVYQESPIVDEYQENNLYNMYGNLPTNINNKVNKAK